MKEFTTPVGVDLIAIALPASHIRGIEVNNPSGSWLRITGIEQFVPPWTEGWAAPVSPAAASLDVRFTDAPSGSLSSETGGPILVRLLDHDVPASVGGPSGSGAKQATTPPMLSALGIFGTGPLVTLITNSNPGGGHRIVVRRLSLTPDLSAGLGTPQPFRSMMTVEFASQGGAIVWVMAISPETPFAESTFEDGALVLPVAQSLQLVGRKEPDSAKAYFLAMAQYYEVK